jgi:hypothetical protein
LGIKVSGVAPQGNQELQLWETSSMNGNFACKVLLLALFTVALIPAQAQNTTIATASIPFDFFIYGDRLPKGEYVITTFSTGVLCFYGKTRDAVGQAFTMHGAEPVSSGDAKLVFVRIYDQYRFASFYAKDGVWRNSTIYQTELPPGVTRHNVPVTYLSRD